MADVRLETDLVETKQYIVVQIGNEKYGIDINFIDNIVRMSKITRVPKVQSYFKGVMNLRGEIVPVMSIRKKMGLPEDVITDASRIIIIKLEEKVSIGIIVDEVREVIQTLDLYYSGFYDKLNTITTGELNKLKYYFEFLLLVLIFT